MGTKVKVGTVATPPREPSTQTSGLGGAAPQTIAGSVIVDPCCDQGAAEDLAAVISSVEALDMQLNALDVTVGGNYNAGLAVDTSQNASIASLQAQIAAMKGAPVPLPFVTPAGGWDTSFDFDPAVATNPDLSANGWTVALTHSPWTVLTRAGDVRWLDHVWAAAASGPVAGVTQNYPPAAGTYYSSLVGGRLLLQLPGQTDVSIYRATTATPQQVWAGVGGGSANNHARALYISSGNVGAAGVNAGYVNETTQGVSGYGTNLPGMAGAAVGSQAIHYALEASEFLASPADKPPGRYLRGGSRNLFGQSADGYATAALIDTGFGNGGNAPMSRVALRLYSGPVTYNTELTQPLQIFYIRRRPHRSAAYW